VAWGGRVGWQRVGSRSRTARAIATVLAIVATLGIWLS
jgi:hypothetical protein